MESLSLKMERYFEERVKQDQANLSNKTRNLTSQLAPIVAELRSHPVSKLFGLDFEEPFLSAPSLDILSEDDKGWRARSFEAYRVMLPITLDETVWKCQPPVSFEKDRTRRIYSKAGSPYGSANVSVKVSQEVQRLDQLPEIYRDLSKGYRFSPGRLDFEMIVRLGPQGITVLVVLYSDCFKCASRLLLEMYPVLKTSHDAECHVLLPRFLRKPSGQWRKLYTVEENSLIQQLDNKEEGIRCKVERMLKYASRPGSSSPLSILDPYVYTNAVLNIGRDPQWDTNNLGGALRMTLTYLKDCLVRKVLNRHFEPEHNLLSTVPKTRLQQLFRLLTTTEKRESYSTLLRLI